MDGRQQFLISDAPRVSGRPEYQAYNEMRCSRFTLTALDERSISRAIHMAASGVPHFVIELTAANHFGASFVERGK